MSEIDTMQIPKNTIFPNRNFKIKRDIPPSIPNTSFYIYDVLVDELGEDVFCYLHDTGAIQNDKIILLSPYRHYFYSSSELKQITTVVNTRETNDTRNIKTFLHDLNRILPMKCYFVGKFTDYKDKKEHVKESYPKIISHTLLLWLTLNHKIVPKIPGINWLQYLYNGCKLGYLTSRTIKGLLAHNGFNVIDIKQINGVSYFISQKTVHLKMSRKFSLLNFVNDLNTPYRNF